MARAELDPSLRKAAEAGTPVEVVDPISGLAYYLISAEQYQKMRGALTGDFDPQQTYPMIDTVMADDDAEDPLLDSYQ